MRHDKTKTRLIHCAVALLFAGLMLAQFGCQGETVRALDYSTEDELYTGQSDPDAQSGSPEAEQTDAAAATPASPTATAPTPTPDTASASPAASQTPASTPTAGGATASPAQTPALFRLTVLVQDASKSALAGARVTLLRDGALLFSGMTGSDGTVSWMLPAGHVYRAAASLAGYQTIDGDAAAYDLSADTLATITLAPAEDGAAEPTTQPVPDGAPGRVVITAESVSIQLSQADFTLLDGVRAQTEFGVPVAVWVVDSGGFRADASGAYRVTYGALEEGTLIYASRTVTVEGEAAQEDDTQPDAPFGSSRERYEILLAYREGIGAQLSERIDALNAAFQKKAEAALSQNAEARILAQAAEENDTDEASSVKDMRQTSDIKVTNWSDVLATFLAQNVPDETHPLDAALLLTIPLEKLDAVFWDMNQIEVFRMDGTTNILLSSKSCEDMADEYGMSAARRRFLSELMQPEFQRTFASMTGNAAFADASEETVTALLETLPENTGVERMQVVETALSLVGKVSYEWGGKYNRLGWNAAWGNANDVPEGETATISRDTGLDCSGFVSWTFINASGSAEVLRAIGNGSSNQWARSTAIGWDEGRPGDLAFYFVPGERQYNHVGIIVSVDDDGSYLVAHCSSLQKGVVVTDAWSNGFRYLRRPVLFE